MKLIKLFIVLGGYSISFFIFNLVYANSPIPSTLTAPTSSSKPLPTMQNVQNIDTVLSESIQAKIANSPILKGQSVSAVSHKKSITLEGSVETKAQEEEAIKIVKSVKGIKDVKSQLTIKGSSTQ